MFKYPILVIFCFLIRSASAQKQSPAVSQKLAADIPTTQPYGKIDIADLELKQCDFEKDANAEILFDKCLIRPDDLRKMQRHIRIKIFNDHGKKAANVHLIYRTEFFAAKTLKFLEGETINLVDGNVVVTPIDKKQIYIEKLNKNFSALIFTFPNVKAGSVIEYKYESNPPSTWFFQDELPTRYSEIETNDQPGYFIGAEFYLRQTLVANNGEGRDSKQVRALANVHSLPNEPFMTGRTINLQRVVFSGNFFTSGGWDMVTDELVNAKYFGGHLNEKLTGEEKIYAKAATLKTNGEKIAYLFDTVKNVMKWDEKNFFMTVDGIAAAWDKKTGNSGEINLILYHFLNNAGLGANPMIVSTIDFGIIDPTKADPYAFNNTVVLTHPDSTRYYVLDASSKFNLYNTVPFNILNTYGLAIDIKKKAYALVKVEDKSSEVQLVFLNADIKAEGKMSGTAEITSDSYNKITALKKYQTGGREKYIDSLRNLDNNLKIISFNFENAAVDSLPLTQKLAFSLNLTGSDEQYIYFKTNLFSGLEDNPFKSEGRYSDIDLGYRANFSMNGIYNIPKNCKIEALPKSITIVMPDNSIVFKRIVAQDNGSILVKYIINHKQTMYTLDKYQDVRGFYQKMYELLNEQIVLKKM